MPIVKIFLETFVKTFPPLAPRYENRFGRDESKALPRCLMAAQFRTEGDPTGEICLKHWISLGHIQD